MADASFLPVPVPTSPADSESLLNPRGTKGVINVSAPAAVGDPADHLLSVRLGGAEVFSVNRDGTTSLQYGADLTPDGGGTPVAAVATFTPPTSSTATFVVGGISVTSTFDTDADTTVNNLITAVEANDSMNALVAVTLVAHKALVTSKVPGIAGNAVTTTSDAAHGASFDTATLTGGTGYNATLNVPSGRVVMDVGTQILSVQNSLVTTTSIILTSLTFDAQGGAQVINVVPQDGYFTIYANAPVAVNAVTVSFTIQNP